MDQISKKDSLGLTPSQIAWVVKDVEKATGTTRLQDYDGTYYGELFDAENLVTMTYSCGTFIEIIQPISGKSIFKDYIDNNPTGGICINKYNTVVIPGQMWSTELMT